MRVVQPGVSQNLRDMFSQENKIGLVRFSLVCTWSILCLLTFWVGGPDGKIFGSKSVTDWTHLGRHVLTESQIFSRPTRQIWPLTAQNFEKSVWNLIIKIAIASMIIFH